MGESSDFSTLIPDTDPTLFNSLPIFFTSFQAILSAAVNSGGAGPRNPANAVLSACLTKDGNTCYPGSRTLDSLPLTSALAGVTFVGGNTQSVGDLWQSTPGTSAPDLTAQAIVSVS